MPRGGRRNGRQGASYTNRTDLNQSVRTAPSQEYGSRVAQERQQQAAPLPQAPPTPDPRAAAQYSYVEDVPNLTDPTGRPDEPITAGLPFGAGPGPRMDMLPSIDPVADELRALYLRYPTQELLELIEMQELS